VTLNLPRMGSEHEDGGDSGDEEQESSAPNLVKSQEDGVGNSEVKDSVEKPHEHRAMQSLKELDETGLCHKLEFRDEGEYMLHSRHWKGPFDLVEARKGISARERKKIAEI
jgi:hypothetical protein